MKESHFETMHLICPLISAETGNFIENAGVWRYELNQIYDISPTCKLCGKTPACPVVTMLTANRFNEKMAITLKSRKGKYILSMVNLFTLPKRPQKKWQKIFNSTGLVLLETSLKEFSLAMKSSLTT